MTVLNQESANNLAVQGFLRLAADDDLLMRFSAITGILPNDMRQSATDPHFLVGVLDFFLGHEPDLLAWAEADNIDPQNIVAARMALAPEDMSGFE